MKHHRRMIAVAGLLAVAAAWGWSQSAGYVIKSVAWDITGRTKQYSLERVAEITIGERFPDRAALDTYIASKKQVLGNERALASVEIEVREGEAGGAEDPVPVELSITTVDTWNIVVLPYFKYDSNTGLLLAGRGRDYDFLGSLEVLYLNVDFLVSESGQMIPGVSASLDLPFAALGRDWTWSAAADVELPEGDPVGITLSTGLSTDQPIGPFTLTLSGNQYFYSGQQAYSDPYYFLTNIGVDFMATLYESPTLGKLKFGPQLDLDYRYAPGGLSDSALASTPTLTPALAYSFGRANWAGNFRTGLTTSGAFKVVDYLDSGTLSPYFVGSVAAYSSLGWAGPSARLAGIWYLSSSDSSAGGYTRGILDSRIKTDAGLFLSTDFPVRVITFDPTAWFPKAGWMRYFAFEQHWSPFFDCALVHDSTTDRWFDPHDGWYGAGLEVITFPKFARSIYLRISAGWSLPDVLQLKALSGPSPRDGRGIYEIFVGLGSFY